MFARVVVAATAVMLTTGVAPAGAIGAVSAAGPLSDLSPTTHATDGAYARLYAVAPGNGSTYFYFVLTGLDPAAVGTTFGAHVHVGPCVAGSGAAAGPHYNSGTGGVPSTQNEVWLDFTVRPGGVGVSSTTVPFEIAPGTARSVVVHAQPTQEGTGIAGPRIACLGVDF